MRRRRRPLPRALVAVMVVAALAMLLVIGGEAGAQRSDPAADQGLDDRIQILGVELAEDRVVLEIAVPPAIGKLAPVAGNFGVTDGGDWVDVDVVPIETAADTVIVLDTSGSMRGSALVAAKAAAAGFVEALPDDARVGLISFGDTVVIHREPTVDRAVILADLAGLEAGGEETVLWDALVVAAEMVGGSDAGLSSAVVLSDGDDTASADDPDDVVRQLQAGSTALYAVAIESPDTDLAALEETVDRAGGQFLATTDIGQLDSLYTDIAGRLANRYRLGFTPAHDGERSVVVSVAADGEVATARTVIDGGGSTSGGTSEGPAPVLNLDDEQVLGPVASPSLGPLADQTMLWIGLGSMFAAFAIAGLIITRPASQVRIDAVAGADRIGGINVRMGLAADRLISRHDRGRRIDGRLEAAEVSLRPGEFVLAWAVATGLVALVAAAIVGIALGALVVTISALGVVLYLGARASRRRARFADQLTETLSIMASSLRAGQSLPQAIELVAAEAPSPTAEQFHRISFELRVGRDLTESIQEAADRMASPDLNWLAQAVDINRELGGDLSEIMDNVADTIRERRTVARQINALSAEGRATAWVLLAMPVILFLFAWWRTPESTQTLLTEPLGRLLLAVAVAGMTVGHLWIRHLVKLRY